MITTLAARRLLLNGSKEVLTPTLYGLSHPIPMWFFFIIGVVIPFCVVGWLIYTIIQDNKKFKKQFQHESE